MKNFNIIPLILCTLFGIGHSDKSLGIDLYDDEDRALASYLKVEPYTPKNKVPFRGNHHYELGLNHYLQKDYETAYSLFEQAVQEAETSKSGSNNLIDPTLYYLLCKMRFYGLGCSICTDVAQLEYIDYLWHSYEYGMDLYCRDEYSEAIQFFKQAAMDKYSLHDGLKIAEPFGFYMLHYMYAKGDGVQKDIVIANAYYKKMSIVFNDNSLQNRSMIQNRKSRNEKVRNLQGKLSYIEGIKLYKKGDYKRAKSLFEESAKEENVDGQFMLGFYYHYGFNGVTQSYEEAIKYYSQAAAKGHALAKDNLEAIKNINSFGVFAMFRPILSVY